MPDLNDLYVFAQVAEHGGFATAGRALGIPKSTLSRRIALLEERLGVRLLQRSTRHFAITEVGQLYLRHCLALIEEAKAAQEAIDRTRAEPQGVVRISCPVPLAANHLAPIVARFLADHPGVRVHLEATNRRVDVIEEGFDLALRVRIPPLEDTELVIRVLESHGSALVAAPALLARLGRPERPEDLTHLPSLDMSRPGGAHAWRLNGPDSSERTIALQPRLVTDDMTMLRRAALDGIGVAALPHFMVGADLAQGGLEPLLPEWVLPCGIVHAVFPSRRGLVPAVRRFIDLLAKAFAKGTDTMDTG